MQLSKLLGKEVQHLLFLAWAEAAGLQVVEYILETYVVLDQLEQCKHFL